VIAASILNGDDTLAAVQKVLPVHYWQVWTSLFDSSGTTHLGTGIAVQIGTIIVAAGVAVLVLIRRDPAA
jgi:ABC-2 type transport system permease protein